VEIVSPEPPRFPSPVNASTFIFYGKKKYFLKILISVFLLAGVGTA